MYHRGLVQTVAPASEPVTTAEAKTHLRVTHANDDAYIDSLIKAAREYVEERTYRQLITATWKQTHDEFPDTIILSRPPLLSVTSIKYIDTDGVQQTLVVSDYLVDSVSEPARITPAYEEVWPGTRYQLNAIEVLFQAGYGASASSVPERFKTAIKWLVAHWYEVREAVNDAMFNKVPLGVDSLLYQLSLGYRL